MKASGNILPVCFVRRLADRIAILTILSGMLLAPLPAIAADEATQDGHYDASAQPVEQVSFRDALELTDEEFAALQTARDRDDEVAGDAFYLLLAKTAGLAERPGTSASLDQPAVESLLRYPQRWRGWPVRLTMQVYSVRKLQGPGQLAPSTHWPTDMPVWQVNGLADDGQPITAFCPIEPRNLGESSGRNDAGEQAYPAAKAEIEGFFLKLWRRKDREGNIKYYPVLVTWRIGPPTTPGPAIAFRGDRMMPVLLMGGMLCLYLFIRRRIRSRSGQEEPLIRPYRSGWHRKDSSPEESTSDQDEGVDPQLKEAVVQYRKDRDRKETDDAADRSR